MCKVLVHRPWFGFCAGDGDVGGRGIVEEIVAACEALVEFWESPWGDDADRGLEGVECEFETDLVVAFAGAAVGDCDAAGGLGDFDLGAGDDGAGEGCSCWEKGC